MASFFRSLLLRLRSGAHGTRAQRDLDDEIRLHMDLLERQERDRGLAPDAARAAARRRFGNPVAVAEHAAEAAGLRWLDDLRQDLRYGVRSLLNEKRFALTSLLTLALGIGATTAIFSVVSALVFRPLPFAEPDRLVFVHGTSPLALRDSVFGMDTIRRDSTSFDSLAGCEVGARYLRDSLGAERVMTVKTERDFFRVLGVPPIGGRTWNEGDAQNVAVVSEGFWRRRLGADPAAVGSVLRLDDEPVTIIGVMPDWFQFPYGAASLLPGVASQTRTDMWMPLPATPAPRMRMGNVVGRLKPGVTLGTAQGELSAIAARLAIENPDRYKGRDIRVVPLAHAVVSPPIRRVLFILFGAVGLVLALACANVTNLSLARMTLRGREVAIRAALGARRMRLIRQFLTESLLVSLAGGILGLGLAWWGTQQILAMAAAHIPRSHEIGIDWRVFAFLFVACAVTGAALGVAPAALAARRDARDVLQQSGTQSTASRTQRWIRDALVVGEVAIAVMLAIGAAVLVRELVRLRHTDSGMTTGNVVTLHVGHRMTPRNRERPHDEDVRQFYDIADRAAQLAGVRAAGFTQLLPLQNWGWTSNSRDFRVRGEAYEPPAFPIQLAYVTPDYFRALGVGVVKGRGFTAQDDRDAPGVIVINETLARRYFGDRDPIGLETTRGTIVGVVRDVRQAHLDRSAAPEIYYPVAQNWSQVSELGMTLVVSTQDRPEPFIDRLRQIVRDVNPNLAVFNIKTMERVVDESLSDFTLYLSLMAAFAGVALVLAVSGTYGVISFAAMSRVREFAIRMALGADRGRVMGLVIRQGTALALAGIVIGVAAAIAAAPLLRNLPVSVRPPDLLTTVPVALLLGAIAIVACAVPARRASRTDPMVVLRTE
jgi:putative ABC transport system permease protein